MCVYICYVCVFVIKNNFFAASCDRNSLENSCNKVIFFSKVAVQGQRHDQHPLTVFSNEFSKFCQNSRFREHQQKSA